MNWEPSEQQTLASFTVRREDWSRLSHALRDAGFDVRASDRAGGALMRVLIREGTEDEAEAVAIIDRLAPWSRREPGSASTTHVEGYREGRA